MISILKDQEFKVSSAHIIFLKLYWASYLDNCDRIFENIYKSHMTTYAYVFTENFLHSSSNLSFEFHVVLWNIIKNAILFMWQR